MLSEPGFTIRYAWSEFQGWAEATANLIRQKQR